MKKIIHGGDIYSQPEILWLDYSANINPLGLSDNVRKAFFESIDKSVCYPDPLCRALINKIAVFENVVTNNIICSNGAADLIYRICYAVKPKKALLIAPTFAEYAMALNNIGCCMKYYNLSEKNNFKVNYDIVDMICDIDIMFICNPNNPTGVTIDNDILEQIINRAYENNCIVVIDECFNDFMEKSEDYSVKDKIKYNDNIIILKAFTKIFAIPGLRLGYALINNDNIKDNIYNAGQPWSVSTVANNVGIACLDDLEYINKTKKLIKEEREFLTYNLRKLGFKVFESQTNYILFKNIFDIDLAEKLKLHKILIRCCDNYINLDNKFFRIAVKNRNDNIKLITAVKEVLNV